MTVMDCDGKRKRTMDGPFGAVLLLVIAFICSCGASQARRMEQAQMHIDIGAAYIEAGDNGEAIKELTKAQQFTPDNPRIHYFLAVAYQGRGYTDRAVAECRKAIALKPDDSEAHNFLGTLYMGLGKDDLAAASFLLALENVHYDTPSLPLYNLARVYYRMERYDEALRRFQEAAAKNQRGDLLPFIEFGMGRIAYDRGEVPRAIRHFRRSVDLAPSLADAYFWLGEAYARHGQAKEAKEAFATVVRLTPDSDLGRAAKEKTEKIRQ